MVHERHLPAPGRRVPTSTYRLQLQSGFTFDDTAELMPYLAGLGVSHVFCSPILQAARGSTHGYDVVNHGSISGELGGAAGFRRLVEAARSHGLGIVVDVVPNHMSIAPPQDANRAWWDVLQHGRKSAYVEWFDIEWESGSNPGKVLVPILGAPIAQEISAIRIDTTGSEPVLRYHEHVLPIAPKTLADDLVETLDAQHYRLCDWRVAADELNYRRFFDITSLIGVRVEDPKVFSETHEVLLRHVADGAIDGLRIDHPDGLTDPLLYLDHLQRAAGRVWVVVEKVLEPGESLPAEWGCAGTTGYDALNRITGLFVDPAGEDALTTLYGELTEEPTSYADVVADSKRRVLRSSLNAEINRLVEVVIAIRERDLAGRDFTRRTLTEALVELVASFDVYRAYVRPGEPPLPAADERLRHAARAAAIALPERAAEIDYLYSLARGEALSSATGRDRRRRAEFVTRFQQTCGPAMAKGIEDTAFYRYYRLVALNEVGGDPGQFGLGVEDFHAANIAMQRDWPLTMTTLSTHDTKRSEDVRARLTLLSEMPREWGDAVVSWMTHNERYRRPPWPDRNVEYLLYQTLVGAWPLSAERALGYVRKAVREAKQHTSWTAPSTDYDEAIDAFVAAVCADDEFQDSLTNFVEPLVAYGELNSLAQKLVQLTMPGVPDVYQGNETWDYSLVDPDNRRPVDFGLRGKLLESPADRKFVVTTRTLQLRKARPEWFGAESSYEPLYATGSKAAHVIGFVRSGSVATVVPRLVLKLRGSWQDTKVQLPPGGWRNEFTGRAVDGVVAMSELLDEFPVALLVRQT